MPEGLQALASIQRLVPSRAAEAERRATEAEAEHLAMRKLAGFVNEQIAEFQTRLAEIERRKET